MFSQWGRWRCIGHIMAKRQSAGTSTVVGDLANRLDKGSDIVLKLIFTV